MAVTSKYDYTGTRTLTILNPLTSGDTAFNNTSLDTATSRAQYILTGGTIRGPLRLSATERLIAGWGKTFNVPSIRASFVLSVRRRVTVRRRTGCRLVGANRCHGAIHAAVVRERSRIGGASDQ